MAPPPTKSEKPKFAPINARSEEVTGTRYYSESSNVKLKAPILASIFYSIGVLVVIATLLFAGAGLLGEEKIMALPVVLLFMNSRPTVRVPHRPPSLQRIVARLVR